MSALRLAASRYGLQALLVVLMVACGAGLGGWVLTQQIQRPRLPWEGGAWTMWAEFDNAQGVQAGQGQSVQIAGVRIGRIGDVRLVDGFAKVELQLEEEYAGRVRQDATALLRPRTILKDQFVELDPGRRDAPALREGATLSRARTAPDVNPDEITAVLDADTRDYLRALVVGLGKGFDGSGRSVRGIFETFEPLHRDLERASRAFADNDRLVRRLVRNTRVLGDAIAAEDGNLTDFVQQNEAFLSTVAGREDELAAAIGELPSALDATTRALDRTGELSRVSIPAFEALRPAARSQDAANRAGIPLALQGTPILRDQVRPFVRSAQPYLRVLERGTRRANAAGDDGDRSLVAANRGANMLAYNPGGRERLTGDPAKDAAREEGYGFWLAWAVQTTNSMFSVSDAAGPYRRAINTVSCTTLRSAVSGEPALEPILAVSNILDDAGLCPKDAK